MAAPFIVTLPHKLGRDEAVRRLRSGLARAASTLPIISVDEEKWEGDRMSFRVRAMGQVASGHVDVGEDFARVEVTLPWLLQRFAQVAQATIQARGKMLLDKPK